jgi:hypothetical protein
MCPKNDYKEYEFQFASPFIALEVAKQQYKNFRMLIINFVQSTHPLRINGNLRGTLFENIAHTILAKGGNFKAINLETRRKVKLVISPDLQISLFSTKDGFRKADSGHYMCPVQTNFASVDSMLKPNILFQITVAKSHSCAEQGLMDALEYLKCSEKPKLFFVTTAENFHKFKLQKYTRDGLLKDSQVNPIVKRITQYALLLPLSSEG